MGACVSSKGAEVKEQTKGHGNQGASPHSDKGTKHQASNTKHSAPQHSAPNTHAATSHHPKAQDASHKGDPKNGHPPQHKVLADDDLLSSLEASANFLLEHDTSADKHYHKPKFFDDDDLNGHGQQEHAKAHTGHEKSGGPEPKGPKDKSHGAQRSAEHQHSSTHSKPHSTQHHESGKSHLQPSTAGAKAKEANHPQVHSTGGVHCCIHGKHFKFCSICSQQDDEDEQVEPKGGKASESELESKGLGAEGQGAKGPEAKGLGAKGLGTKSYNAAPAHHHGQGHSVDRDSLLDLEAPEHKEIDAEFAKFESLVGGGTLKSQTELGLADGDQAFDFKNFNSNFATLDGRPPVSHKHHEHHTESHKKHHPHHHKDHADSPSQPLSSSALRPPNSKFAQWDDAGLKSHPVLKSHKGAEPSAEEPQPEEHHYVPKFRHKDFLDPNDPKNMVQPHHERHHDTNKDTPRTKAAKEAAREKQQMKWEHDHGMLPVWKGGFAPKV